MKQETPTKRGATQDVSALEDAERNDLLSPMLDTDENANSEAGNLKWKQAARARRTRRKKQQLLYPLLLCGVLLLACIILLFANREIIATSAQGFFDRRPDLTDVLVFESLATQEIESISVLVQSATYPDYTETKTITDPDEIAQFVQSIVKAKQVVAEGEEAQDEDASVRASISLDTDAADCYTITFADEVITFYTQKNDGHFIYIDGDWQALDFVTQPDFYTWYLASAADATIYDTNELIYYPQEWTIGETEIAEASYGVDVSYHQGVIDWEQVAADGVDFAMIRVGVRYAESGVLQEDPLARYNLQEATKYGIAVGVYFFSTATTEAEVLEEVTLTLELISGYAITYPVVYDCEMFHNEENRNSSLTIQERSYLAEVFLNAVENAGYTGMFYASKNDLTLNAQWETNYLQSKYRIWVAQYPGDENDAVPAGTSSYEGRHEMWQYTCEAEVAGIEGGVDRNVAYFSYSEFATPLGTSAEEVEVDYDLLANMQEANDEITAKELVNVRSSMDSTADDNIIGQLTDEDVATRVGMSGTGWSKIEYGDGYGYVVTSLITTVE